MGEGRLRSVPDMMNPETDDLKPAHSDLYKQMENLPAKSPTQLRKPNLQLSLILLSLHVPPDVVSMPEAAPAGAPAVSTRWLTLTN